MKKCKVIINKNKETTDADFYGVFQKSYTHQESLVPGGFPAGQIAYPVAVVDWGEGLREVGVHEVKEVAE